MLISEVIWLQLVTPSVCVCSPPPPPPHTYTCTQAIIIIIANQKYVCGAIVEFTNNYEPLTISPVAAQCNGACGKRSSIECVNIDRCWPQKSWRWRLRSTLNLDSDKFRCFNHRDELDSTVFLQVGHAAAVSRGPAPCDDACYI